MATTIVVAEKGIANKEATAALITDVLRKKITETGLKRRCREKQAN